MKEIDIIVEVSKFNPYHDRLGRFTTAGGAASMTFKPGASRAHDNAIERERIKQNHYYGKDRAEVEEAWHRLNAGYGTFREYERRPASPYDGDIAYHEAKISDYDKRMKDAEDMLAFMDKYGNEIYERERPKRNNSSYMDEYNRETLRQVSNMVNNYKPKRKQKQKPEFTQTSLFT